MTSVNFPLSMLTLALGLAISTPITAAPVGCDGANDTVKKLLRCVTLKGVRQHQGKFQTIADANKGQRSAETAGYRQSAFYVRDQLKAAGYRVTLQPFEFLKYYEIGPSTFEKTAPPTPVLIFTQGENFDVMTNSDAGEATAAVRAVGDFDEVPNPPNPGPPRIPINTMAVWPRISSVSPLATSPSCNAATAPSG